MFKIRMGIPEMHTLWEELAGKAQSGSLRKDEAKLYQQWGKALKLLARNPRHPGLESHEIAALSRRYGKEVWQSYLESKTPAAGRLYWVYGPGTGEITVIGIEPHPEDRKGGGYARVRLSAVEEPNRD